GPLNDLPDVRFALSNDALKTTGSFKRPASSANVSAMRKVKSCDSMTHGPSIHISGRLGPQDTFSVILTTARVFMIALRGDPSGVPDSLLVVSRTSLSLAHSTDFPSSMHAQLR